MSATSGGDTFEKLNTSASSGGERGNRRSNSITGKISLRGILKDGIHWQM